MSHHCSWYSKIPIYAIFYLFKGDYKGSCRQDGSQDAGVAAYDESMGSFQTWASPSGLHTLGGW